MTLTAWNTLPISTVDVINLLNTDFNMYTTEPLLPEEWVKFHRILVGNWYNEQPYEVKSRESCPKLQNIHNDGFRTMRDNTQRAPLSKVNINPKLSSTGSSGSRVHDKRLQNQCLPINYIENNRRNTQNIWMSGKKAEHKLSKSVRGGSGHGFVQGQHNGKIVRHRN
ncbi:unnamed protein product [Schistosoma margrebowiei]|uniref:Uncharacterized protein n=1 Tax=Schistosoma margrebowiei TaxID=48269 RepID=A0AA85AL82_9TREM|nr:unnamed protein product [Schistosoma margrebowiei]